MAIKSLFFTSSHYLWFFVLLSCSSITANATLLGRLNAYYSDKITQLRDPDPTIALTNILDLQTKFEKRKNNLNEEITNKYKEIEIKRKEIATPYPSLPEALEREEPSARAIAGAEQNQLYTEFESLQKRKDHLDEVLTEIDKVKTALSELQKTQSATLKNAATETTDSDKYKKFLNDYRNAKESVEDEYKKLERLSATELLLDETVSGVHPGPGDASFITSNASASVGINAYQYNVLFGYKGCDDSKSACDTLPETHLSIPMYIFLRKTSAAQADNTTLSNDLLDNEYGGSANIKWSKGLKIEPFSSFLNFEHDADPRLKQYGLKFLFDGGFKFVEVPPIAVVGAPTATTTTNWVTAGYWGLGLNLELPIFVTSSDLNQNITAGANPAGGLAIGFGVYQNIVDRSQFDKNLTQFTQQIPGAYWTRIIMYEMQITKLFSVKGTRVAPLESNNPLGTYSSFQMGYKFD